jgi:hypothetical protein
VSRVREWLEAATAPRDRSRGISSQSSGGGGSASTLAGHPTRPPPPKRLLILCGKPGTGKSTCVRVLARELQLRLSEFVDTFGQVLHSQTWQARDGQGGERMLPDPSRDDASEAALDRDFRTPYASQIDLFNKFLRSGCYEPLTLGLLRRAKAAPAASSSDTASALFTGNRALGAASSTGGGGGGGRRTVLLMESLPSTSPTASSFGGDGGDQGPRDSPLDQLRASLVAFLADGSAAPAVLVFSDVAEKNEAAPALERLFTAALTSSPLVDVIEFNAVTEREFFALSQPCPSKLPSLGFLTVFLLSLPWAHWSRSWHTHARGLRRSFPSRALGLLARPFFFNSLENILQ